MSDTAKQLLALKEMIDEAKTNKIEFQGELNGVMKELKDKWKCSSLKTAQEKNETNAEKLKKLNNQLNEFMSELEEKYEI